MHSIFAPAFTDYWAPMIGSVGQLAARRAQIALPRRLPMDWAFPMIGFVGQLAARRPQVALPGLYRCIGHLMAIRWPLS